MLPPIVSGLLPYNCLCVQAGGALAELRSVGDVIDTNSLLELLAVAILMGVIGAVAKKRNQNPSFQGTETVKLSQEGT